MKQMFAVFCFALALSVVAFAQAQPAQGGEMMKKSEKKAEKKAEKAKPQGDGDIQKCIADKFANSEKLKSQGFSAAVSGGTATLTGNAANAGSKGAATGIAKRCGATKVENNITAPAVKKSDKSGEKKSDKKG